MALINDNQVEEVRRQHHLAPQLYLVSSSVFIVIIIVFNILTSEQGEEALDGRNDDIAVRRYFRRLQAIDSIDSIEGVTILRQSEHAKLTLCLFSQIVAVYQEQDATHGSESQKAIGGHTGGIGLSGTCSQHHQSSILTRAEALLQF